MTIHRDLEDVLEFVATFSDRDWIGRDAQTAFASER